jgi:hypothetical protein
MTHRGLLVAGGLMLAVAGGATMVEAQEPSIDLPRLASGLDLTERGAVRWLELLEAKENGAAAERLLAVSATGEHLLERDGGRSSVVVGVELDGLLLRSNRSVVLIHNHPSNVGLSAADIGQLVRPGVAAIVAIGHDRSVFVAAPGLRMDPHFLVERQYARAQAEVKQRLREAGPGRIPVADSDAQFSHLVARALAKAGIIGYWFELRGMSRGSYETARVVFGQVVEGAAARLRR